MLDKWPINISHHHWFLYWGSKLIQSFLVAKINDDDDNDHFRLIRQRNASDSLHISSSEKAIFPPAVPIACVRDSTEKRRGETVPLTHPFETRDEQGQKRTGLYGEKEKAGVRERDFQTWDIQRCSKVKEKKQREGDIDNKERRNRLKCYQGA